MFLTVAVCTAQVLAQLGAFTFFALLPTFFQEWDLSHSEAGILNGIIFGAYALSVPLVVPLTDRLDPRRIYICAVGLTTCSHLGMAFMADGFWDGFLFRALAGIGWGGTYMVGLKALADLIEGPAQSRAVAFHAASIGIGGSLSFVLAGWAADIISWQAAFQLSAAGSFLALLVMAFLVPGRQPQAPDDHGWLAAFLRAFRNKSAIAYSLGYC
ncbi:MAG: MFS transporter, partial [Alphaproteobacteria bacterium]|nr:MFS transporter [Alphaproteobacteria bacterium]